jgi:hypothetical protein
MPRDIGPIEDLGWNQTDSVKRESAGILAGSAQIMLDRESVDQGSITPSPPEISPDFRGKLGTWESLLIPAPRSPRKAAMQGRITLRRSSGHSPGAFPRSEVRFPDQAVTASSSTCISCHSRTDAVRWANFERGGRFRWLSETA